MEKQSKFKQSYNERSKKWVLIDCSDGIKGGMTGKMQAEKFEGVPVVKGPKNSQNEDDKKDKKQGPDLGDQSDDWLL